MFRVFLLVVCDQCVEVRTALTGWDIIRRSGIEDPVIFHTSATDPARQPLQSSPKQSTIPSHPHRKTAVPFPAHPSHQLPWPRQPPHSELYHHLLGKLQIHMPTRRAILEQIPITRRLLDHRRMQRIPRRPPLLVLTIAIYHPGENRLRSLGGRTVCRAGEFVDAEGEGEDAQGDVESALVGEGLA